MTGNTTATPTPTLDQLVEAVHPWVEHDVTRDQIKSVIWGIYRGLPLHELNAYITALAAAGHQSMEEAQTEVDHQVDFHYHRIGHD